MDITCLRKIKKKFKVFSKSAVILSAISANLFFFAEIKPVRAVSITIPLNYSDDTEDNLRLTGSFTIETDNDGGGARNSDGTTGGAFSPVPSWITAISLTVTNLANGSTVATYDKSDVLGVNWDVKTALEGTSIDFTGNIVSSFDNISFFNGSGLTGGSSFAQEAGGEGEFTLTSTPAPPALLTLPILFTFYKKLKSYRIN